MSMSATSNLPNRKKLSIPIFSTLSYHLLHVDNWLNLNPTAGLLVNPNPHHP